MTSQSLKSGWKMVKFGDIAQNVAVRVDPADAKTDVYVGLEHLDPSTIHLRQWGHPSDVTGQKLAFKKGDVIFGRRRAYQRKLAVAEFDGICSAHAMVVRAKPKMILPEFLPFFLQSDMFMERAIEISVGSLSPTINWKTLKVQEFPLPPLDEQKRIAEILWAADEAVEQWRRVYSVLNILISVHRVEFFSRKNWTTKKLKNLFSVQLGKMLSPKAKTGNSSFPYLANYNVQWDRIDLEKVQEMDFSEKEREKFALAPGDILVCEGGEVGRSAIWHGEIENCYYQKALHRLRPISNFSSEVMLQFMMWADRKGLFKALTGHSTIAHLTAIKLKEMDVPVPSDKEQALVELLFRELKSARHIISEQIAKTTELKQSLSCGLLSNGVRHV
jgi:restriction endonuclease S subunit